MTTQTLPNVLKSLINSYAVLIMAGRKTIEDVPVTFKIGATEYQLRELVEIEVAERTIAALS